MYFFDDSEFLRPPNGGGNSIDWKPKMAPRLLVLLDTFRFQWGAPVMISPAWGAIGRFLDDDASQHNIERWGEVRAIDLMPYGMVSAADRQRAFNIASSLGFTGIGLYPDWQPRPGIHLDVRIDQRPGFPATWAGVDRNGKQEYINIFDVLEKPL